MARGRTKGWSERGEKGGRPKGSFKEGATGRRKVYKNFTVSCLPSEYDSIKQMAEEKDKTISRLLVDSVLDPQK